VGQRGALAYRTTVDLVEDTVERDIISCVLVGSLLFATGCSSSYEVSSASDAEKSFSTFNADVQNRSGVIVCQDDRELDATNIVASPDSTRFVNEQDATITIVPTATVKRVVFKNRLIGFLEWAGIGALVCGGIGIALSSSNQDASGVGASYAIMGGPVGVVIGGIGGVIAGHRYRYNFPIAKRSER
jgi:hypothetical protein